MSETTWRIASPCSLISSDCFDSEFCLARTRFCFSLLSELRSNDPSSATDSVSFPPTAMTVWMWCVPSSSPSSTHESKRTNLREISGRSRSYQHGSETGYRLGESSREAGRYKYERSALCTHISFFLHLPKHNSSRSMQRPFSILDPPYHRIVSIALLLPKHESNGIILTSQQ